MIGTGPFLPWMKMLSAGGGKPFLKSSMPLFKNLHRWPLKASENRSLLGLYARKVFEGSRSVYLKVDDQQLER